jgi:hypothetical protein
VNSNLLQRSLPIIFLILLVVVPYWKLTTMQGVMITDDIFTSDLMNDGFPYRAYLGEALKQGEFPLWYPPVYGGFPLVARAESGVCFPPTILLFGLFSPYHALNLLILLTIITAAIGMFLYAREITGSTAGGLAAGLSFAWSGFLVCHIKHLSMVGTVSLFPLAFLALERAAVADQSSRSRYPALSMFSLVFGLQFLSGHIQTAYYAGLVYIFYYLLRIVPLNKSAGKGSRTRNHHPWWKRFLATLGTRTAGSFAIALLLAVGVGAVQLLPTYELVQLSQRAGGVSFDYAAGYSYNPASILTFAVPYAQGDISNASYSGRSVFWEDYAYAGVVVLVLGLTAVVVRRKRWHVKFFGIAAVVAYLIVLGPSTPVFEAVFHLLPGMKFFRFPTRFLFVVDASLAVLGAFGVAWVCERFRTVRTGRPIHPIPSLIVLCVATDLVFFNLRQNPIADMRQWSRPPATAAWLNRDSSEFRIYSPGASEAHRQAFALARGWSGDLTPYLQQREFLQASSNVLYGIPCADGYAQLTPEYVVDIWGDQNRKGGLIYSTASIEQGRFRPTAGFVNILSMANVRYVLSPWPFQDSLMEPVDRMGAVFLTRNPSTLPRAYLVRDSRTVHSAAAARSELVNPAFQPGREAILYDEVHLTPSVEDSSSHADVASKRSNEVIVNTSASGERLLVLSDTDYPGWIAEVDGKETRIHRANLSQRAVVVPPGRHTVRFVFEPPTVRWGFVLTLLSCTLLIAGWAGFRRRAGFVSSSYVD